MITRLKVHELYHVARRGTNFLIAVNEFVSSRYLAMSKCMRCLEYKVGRPIFYKAASFSFFEMNGGQAAQTDVPSIFLRVPCCLMFWPAEDELIFAGTEFDRFLCTDLIYEEFPLSKTIYLEQSITI